VLRLVQSRLRGRLDTGSKSSAGEYVRNFGAGIRQPRRGADQRLSSMRMLASSRALYRRAVSGLANAQALYLLPVSLFGMSVSAAELPAMSSALGDQAQVAAQLRQRLDAGLRRIAFFIVPSAVAFLALGDVITAALFQRGRFSHDNVFVCLGDPRRVGGRAAGIYAGPALLLHVLRVAGHAHALAIRHSSCGAHLRAWVSRCETAAGLDRN
jgi:putative peptidoglycan lipid II flippase